MFIRARHAPLTLLSCAVLLHAGVSCGPGDAGIRHYREVVLAAPERAPGEEAAPPSAPGAVAPRSRPLWVTPDGWIEKPGSGMRLAAFDVPAGESRAECTLIELGAEAGDVRSNVERWAGQIGLSPTPQQLDDLIASAPRERTADRDGCAVIDFTTLPPQAGERASMLAAIVTRSSSVLFVKLMAERGVIVAERERFLAL